MQRNIFHVIAGADIDAEHLIGTGQNQLQHGYTEVKPMTESVKSATLLFGNVYECQYFGSCHNKFSFGYHYICSWPLREHPIGADNRPPCLQDRSIIR